jgi:hypothetical protein
MKIKIDFNKTIKEIQDEFRKEFPFLTIEFFKKPHHEHEASEAKDMYPHTMKIKEISSNPTEGVLEIRKDMTVNELEEILEKKFGLHAQVFRKQRLDWIETTTTDDWTLEKQNQTGAEY